MSGHRWRAFLKRGKSYLCGSLRKDPFRKKKMTNTEWIHPHDPDERVANLKDGFEYYLQFICCNCEEEYRTD